MPAPKLPIAVMVIRIASIVLTVAASLALVLGLLFWLGAGLNLISLHMLLGFLAVGALWIIGIGQSFYKGGSWTIAACGLILGAATAYLGMIQSDVLVGEFHWLIQISHLLLGILTIGLGHIGAAHHRKSLESSVPPC